MSDKVFWDIIAFACKPDADESSWYDGLVNTLQQLLPGDIIRFDRWFDEKTDALNSHDLWGAAYLMNGGASDDGFYYFRCWLVGMGKQVYEAALADPDSLADIVDPMSDYYEAEIYGVAVEAWRRLGLDEDDFDAAYDALGERDEVPLQGSDWNFDDPEQMRQRLPRLSALLLIVEQDVDED